MKLYGTLLVNHVWTSADPLSHFLSVSRRLGRHESCREKREIYRIKIQHVALFSKYISGGWEKH